MSLEGDLLAIVGLIYDAAADPSLWPGVLRDLAALGEFHAGTIHFQDLQSHTVGWVSSLNLSPDYEASYQQHYASVNPWVRKRHLLAKGRVNVRAMTMTDREMAATEFWNDWARHLGLFDFAAGVLAQSGTLTGAITMFRPKGAPPCGERELAVMRALTPHVIRATELHRRIAQLERRGDALGAVLDNLSIGIIVVDAARRVYLANTAAEGMLRAADGLSQRHGIISAEHPVEQQRLARAIAASAAVAAGKDVALSERIVVSRPSFKAAYSILVTPCRPQLFAAIEEPAAALFIIDPATRDVSVRELLMSAYGMTPAEAALAERLANGSTLASVAEANAVSRNTVKTQLQQVFVKTNTHRQAELVRLVSSLGGPVRRGDG